MRPLSGGRYAVAAGWRIGAFVAVSLALPSAMAGLSRALDCVGVKGGCWAVSALGGVVGRPVILILLALLLVGPTVRRAKTLGLSAAIAAVVPLLLLLDWRFLTVLGSPWSISFDRGILNSQLPFFTILALALIVTLAIARTPSAVGDGLWGRHGIIGKLGWILAVVAALVGAASAILNIAWLAALASEGMSSPLMSYALRLGRVAAILCLAAMIPFVWIVARELLYRRGEIAP